MSRVAKKPISLPKGVECKVDSSTVSVKGPKGALTMAKPSSIDLLVANGEIVVKPIGDQMKLAGTTRALLSNMVKGVNEGYTKKLELVGVGYRASIQGKELNLTLGFSHPVVFVAPEGISIKVPALTEVLVEGLDKQLVGEVAAKIRAFRPPEPYKGKGVRYGGEKISLKEAKKA